jgi:Tol biopolymer transport system component
VSEAADGAPGNGSSYTPSITADGRYVAFESYATNLTGATAPDCGGAVGTGLLEGCPEQIYVRDRLTGRTTLVSEAGRGAGNGFSRLASISADGSTLAFESAATNLVQGDVNGASDVFVRDLRTRRIELASVSDLGQQGNSSSGGYSHYLSGDGRYVAFRSDASNLVPDDTNDNTDYFVRDRTLGTTTRVSVKSSGAEVHPRPTPGGSTAGTVSISDDGRFVGFDTNATDVVEDDAAGPLHVYVRDRVLGVTVRVSVSSLGDPGNYHSFGPAFSARGGVVAFSSSASNLVPDDTNTGCIAPRNTADNCSDIFVHEIGGTA